MVKNLTVRLRDLESDALDRLAYIYGMSKNTLIQALITQEYELFLTGKKAAPEDNELYFMSLDKDLPAEYEESLFEGDLSTADEGFLKRLIKCYDYAIEKTENEKAINFLEDKRREVVDELRER